LIKRHKTKYKTYSLKYILKVYKISYKIVKIGIFPRKSKKDKLNEQYKKKIEQAYKMSTSNRSESDRLTKEANDILDEIKKIEESEA
tara:strand:- start:48352 stop:48612 length:261 start_codon:yes stop_codon:yes gene_type:complete